MFYLVQKQFDQIVFKNKKWTSSFTNKLILSFIQSFEKCTRRLSQPTATKLNKSEKVTGWCTNV